MKQVDIVGRRKIWFSISSALIVLIIAASFVLGVKLDIQFSGGTIITYTFTGQADKASFEKTVEDSLGQPVTLREQYDVNTGLPNYIITLTNKSGITPDQQIAVNEALQTQFPDNNVNAASISNVDPDDRARLLPQIDRRGCRGVNFDDHLHCFPLPQNERLVGGRNRSHGAAARSDHRLRCVCHLRIPAQ